MGYWIRSGKNLIYYDKQPDTIYWAERWADETLDVLVKYQEKNRPMLVKAFSKYLPRKGKILEAGCGLGPWVKILLECGYDIEGIDSSEMTIERAKAFDASLPVSVGNVLKLDYPNEYFDGYISKGVAEHFEDGPTAMLMEAHRVLKHDGILMMSVPHFNPLRMVTVLRSRCDESKSETFFQYGFTAKEFRTILRESGFIHLATVPYGTSYIKKEMPLISNLISKIYVGEPLITNNSAVNKSNNPVNSLRRLLKNLIISYPVMYVAGHTILLVARKL